MNKRKHILMNLMVILFIVSIFQIKIGPVYANDVPKEKITNETISIETNIEDNLVTKLDKLTFDVWVRDVNDEKIDIDYISVTNNGKNIPINWNDDEKTSYTTDLVIGKNNINIEVNYSNTKINKNYVIMKEEAEDGDVIGNIIFSMDAFTIGLGYIVEPIKVDLIKGERASELLVRILESNGFDYDFTGTINQSFYLAAIAAAENEIYTVEPEIPEALKEALEGNYNENNYDENYLGEFDFNSLSGWMYSVNNIFPNVGYADYYLKDGDVIRTQFTLALGSDIGGGWGNNFFELVNKDALTSAIAEINTFHRDEYLQYEDIEKAYNHSLTILQKVNASQVEIDDALLDLENAVNVIKNSGNLN